jgi:hypothetical protein
VSVRETGNVWSAWDLVDFTVDSAVSGDLAAPTLAVSQGGLPSGAPAVELVLSGVDGSVQVDYSDDGVTWVRATGSLDADGSLWDATAPLDVERSYRARVTDGVHVSAWSDATSHALWCTGEVLVDLITGYAVPAWVTSEDARANPVERDVLHALGRSTAIVSSDVFGADSGGLTVLTDTQARMRDVLAALASGLVMIRWRPEPDADGPGVRPGDDVVQVTSDVTRERVVQKALAYRRITFSWAAQPAPAAVLWVA